MPPSFQKWTVRPCLSPGTQPHHSKPGWPHCGHIKAKHQAISGTSPLQVSDGNASGRRGCDGPNLLPSGSWSSQPLQDKLPRSVLWGWLVETKSVLSLTQQTEWQISLITASLKTPLPRPLWKSPPEKNQSPGL